MSTETIEKPASPDPSFSFELFQKLTADSLSKTNMSSEEAGKLLSDPLVLQALKEAHTNISEAHTMAADAELCLRQALRSESEMTGEDLVEMIQEVEEIAAHSEKRKEKQAQLRSSSPPNSKKTTPSHSANSSLLLVQQGELLEAEEEERVRREEQGEGEGGDALIQALEDEEDEENQREFGNLIQQLLQKSVSKNNTSSVVATSATSSSSSSSSSSRKVDEKLLETLPLIAEFAGAEGTLTKLAATCSKWRGLLLSDSRAIQRTLWVAMACQEFPMEVAELGEDAFLSIVGWSDQVRLFAQDARKKKQ